MRHVLPPISRRTAGKLLAALPAAAVVPAWSEPTQEEADKKVVSAQARFIAEQEPGLSPEERERLQKALTDQEKALAVVRGFELPPDTAPAFRFRAMKSRRG